MKTDTASPIKPSTQGSGASRGSKGQASAGGIPPRTSPSAPPRLCGRARAALGSRRQRPCKNPSHLRPPSVSHSISVVRFPSVSSVVPTAFSGAIPFSRVQLDRSAGSRRVSNQWMPQSPSANAVRSGKVSNCWNWPGLGHLTPCPASTKPRITKKHLCNPRGSVNSSTVGSRFTAYDTRLGCRLGQPMLPSLRPNETHRERRRGEIPTTSVLPRVGERCFGQR